MLLSWRRLALAERAAALAVAVALTTAPLNDVDLDRRALLNGLEEADVVSALIFLARLLVANAPLASGPTILKVIGAAAQWVDSGGEG